MLKETYRNYARYYFDLFTPKEKLLASFHTVKYGDPSVYAIKNMLNERGVVLVSAHVGSWDFGNAYLANRLPGRVNVIVEKLSPGVFKWFTETRERFGVKVIESTDIKSMLRCLRNKELLVLLGDRDLNKNGPVVPFFGKPAHMPAGPAVLSMMTGSNLVTGIIGRHRENPLEFIPDIDTLFFNTEGLERSRKNIEELTNKVIMKLEFFIKKDPVQWCMLQEIWKDEKTV